jgi:hypothetical protein
MAGRFYCRPFDQNQYFKLNVNTLKFVKWKQDVFSSLIVLVKAIGTDYWHIDPFKKRANDETTNFYVLVY